MKLVATQDVERVTEAALVAHGARAEVAASVARAVRVAEENGNRICGLYYVESYCQQLLSGRVDGVVQPEVQCDHPGAVRVDGKLGFAQPAFDAGFETAVHAARTNGVCGYSVEHTHTCTAVGYFTEQFARAGLLAIGATNATARVAPPGGSVAVLGTNPVAMAVPDGSGGVAFQFDFSTSAVALGKITMAAAAGEDIPADWAVDAAGNPTTDPNEALAGSLASAGGYKGFGLGLMVELLAAGLTGGRRSIDVPPLKAPEGPVHDLGQFYLVVDPAAFSGERFHQVVEGLAASVDEQPGTRLPGQPKSPPSEVEVPDELWQQMMSLSDRSS
ncbi:MAG: Ldh family oxidoreductase [Acidimicrobiales bacterium]